MKDFKDMTLEEKEEILEQIRNLPEHKKEDGWDSFDLFTQSFSEISKTWSNSLKEFEALYPDYLKDEDTNPLEKYESKWTTKIRKKYFAHRCRVTNDRTLVNHFLHPKFS